MIDRERLMDQKSPAILWLRQDLRLADNIALEAVSHHLFFAVYIWDDEDPWSPGGASRWWLHKSLLSLHRSFQERGVQLILRKGKPLQVLKHLVQETKACAVYWNRCYEPYVIKRDQEIKSSLKQEGIFCQSFKGSLLTEPWEMQTTTKGAYQVFTPFWNKLKEISFARPLSVPDLQGFKPSVFSESLEEWHFNPTLWGRGLEEIWTPGEQGAWDNLSGFLNDGIQSYASRRDIPSGQYTSRLSPHLHWGEISPTQIWHEALLSCGKDSLPFLRQLGWREFSCHLLFHFPHMPFQNLRVSFSDFPWQDNPDHLKIWQTGQTGYPLVDAGMRELWHTGWMHNRVRMIVASFLVKHLLIPWQQGKEWFWDTLVDADLANNAASWQWVAGSGADAAPYFRIFNPVLQSEKFDPHGLYIKQWVPELQALNSPHIHSPWKASAQILEKAGVTLGKTYPFPLVDHAFARQRALDAFAR
ncbi:deoxyribodipyrimidine photo-lyase [Caedimonas varicaedens]|uniref:Deoxyribodipyrimidine photo-lyase n=1 Tax=Caedimonas varicaedens TaxID=1629334 RepID=A0A0K8ME48_9PROT|nr:deoxyribodipyrimidine photo-lyase [Caedimonas varicaedens]